MGFFDDVMEELEDELDDLDLDLDLDLRELMEDARDFVGQLFRDDDDDDDDDYGSEYKGNPRHDVFPAALLSPNVQSSTASENKNASQH